MIKEEDINGRKHKYDGTISICDVSLRAGSVLYESNRFEWLAGSILPCRMTAVLSIRNISTGLEFRIFEENLGAAICSFEICDMVGCATLMVWKIGF